MDLSRFNVTYDEQGKIKECFEYLPEYHHPGSKSNPFLMKKNRKLIALSSLGGMFTSWALIRESIGRNNFPCVVFAIFAFVSVPITSMPIVARLFLFYNKVAYSKKLEKVSLESLQEAQLLASLKAAIHTRRKKGGNVDKDKGASTITTIKSDTKDHATPEVLGHERPRLISSSHTFANSEGNVTRPLTKGSIRNMLSEMSSSTRLKVLTAVRTPEFSDGGLENNGRIKLTKKITFSQKIARDVSGSLVVSARNSTEGGISLGRLSDFNGASREKFGLKLAFSVIIPFCLALIVVIAISPPLHFGCVGCVARNLEQSIIGAELFIIIGLMTLAISTNKIRNAPDPLYELRDVKLCIITGILSVIVPVIVSLIDPNQYEAQGYITYTYFTVLGVFIIHNIQAVLPLVRIYLSSRRMVKTMKVFTKGDEFPDYGYFQYNRRYYNEGSSSFRGSMYDLGGSTRTQSPKSQSTTKDSSKSLGRELSANNNNTASHRYGGVGPNGEHLDSALSVLLHDDVGAVFFEDYVTGEFSPEGPRFVLACEKWAREFDTSSPSERYKKALQIYSLFIYDGSILQVNIRSEFRSRLDKIFSAGFGPGFAANTSEVASFTRVAGGSTIFTGIAINRFDGHNSNRNLNKKEQQQQETNQRSSIDQVLEEMMEQRKKAEGFFVDLPKDVFNDAMDEVFMLMAIDSYPRFLESTEYNKWMVSDPVSAKRFPPGPGNRLIIAPPPSAYQEPLKRL